MAKTRLLHAVCTVALLAAVPALAQTNTETGSTGAGGAPNNPTAQEATPNQPGAANMAPAGKSMGSHAAMDSHSTHRSAMARPGRGPNAQDAAVDQLNDQSYQAARSGQAFNGPGTTMTPSGSGAPSGSGSMSDMPGGSTSTGTSSSNGSK